jgi:hypothetical protein
MVIVDQRGVVWSDISPPGRGGGEHVGERWTEVTWRRWVRFALLSREFEPMRRAAF